MKKIKAFISLTLVAVSAISLSACNKSEETPSESYKNFESSKFTENSYTDESSEISSYESTSEILGIIEASDEAKRASDAARINLAVKTYQAGIMGGSINESNKPSSLSAYTLPKADASKNEKSEYANKKATIKEAMIYDGIWEELSESVTKGEFGYKNFGYGINDYRITANNRNTTNIIIIKDGDIPIGEIMKI